MHRLIQNLMLGLVFWTGSMPLAQAGDQTLGSDDWTFALQKQIAVDFAEAGMWGRADAYLDLIGPKTQDWNVLLLWSRVKIQLGDIESADKAIRLALAQAPDNPRILFTAGDLALDLNRLDDAEQHYEKALRIQPDRPQIALVLGRLYSRQNKWEKLIPIYERLVSTTDAPSEVWIRLALAHEQAGNLARAETCYREYAMMSRNRAVGLSHLAVFYERTGQKDRANEVRHQIDQLGAGDKRNMRALLPSSR